MLETWNLRRRLTLSEGEIAYDVLGYGPPLILVHGTPSRSYIWRDVDSPNACTNSSQAPTSSCCRRQGTSPWKTAHKKSQQRSSTSSPAVVRGPDKSHFSE